MLVPVLPLLLLSISGCDHSLDSNLTKHDALLVVDMQNDFMDAVILETLAPEYAIPDEQIIISAGRKYVRPGPVAIPNAHEIVEPINKLMQQFVDRGATVLVSLDWHTENHCSFCRNGTVYSNSTGGAFCGPIGPDYPPHFNPVGRCLDTRSLQYYNRKQLMQWPDHCLQNEFGSRFTPYLRVPVKSIGIKKGFLEHSEAHSAFDGTLSFSPFPFWDNDTSTPDELSRQPSLDLLLAGHDIRRLFIVGLATDWSVRMSAIDALDQRFGEVILITSATRGLSKSTTDKAKKVLSDSGVKVLSSDSKNLDDILSETCDYDTKDVADDTSEGHSSAIVALSVLLGLFVISTIALVVLRVRNRSRSVTGSEYVMAR